MRVAVPIGLALAATAASSAIVLVPAETAPDPALAARVAAALASAAPRDEEPIEVEVLRPRPIDAEDPPPLPRRGPTPPERRDARLTVRLVDAETGAAVAMEVRLWRLGVPEDDRWTDGDLEIEKIRVAEDGGSARDLVPGRYRLQCDGQREGADDPPEFVLRPGGNEFTASVVVARTIPLWLRVLDEEGRPVETGRCRALGSTRRHESSRRPRWSDVRAEKLGNGSFRFSGRGAIMGRSCSPGVGPAQLAVAGPEGFSMGAWTEDRRDASERWGARFEFEERSSVRCGAGPRDGKTRTSIAPSVSIERIARGITVEEGGSAVDRGARVEAIADAIPLVEGAPADAWRSIPIRVTVSLVGYETIEFHWRLDATDDENARVMPRDSR